MDRRKRNRRRTNHCEMCATFSNRWAMEKKKFRFHQRQNKSTDSKLHEIEELKSNTTPLEYFLFWLKQWELLVGTIVAFAIWFEILL